MMWKPPWKPLLELTPRAAASARGEHGWVLGAQGPLSPSPGCGEVLERNHGRDCHQWWQAQGASRRSSLPKITWKKNLHEERERSTSNPIFISRSQLRFPYPWRGRSDAHLPLGFVPSTWY